MEAKSEWCCFAQPQWTPAWAGRWVGGKHPSGGAGHCLESFPLELHIWVCTEGYGWAWPASLGCLIWVVRFPRLCSLCHFTRPTTSSPHPTSTAPSARSFANECPFLVRSPQRQTGKTGRQGCGCPSDAHLFMLVIPCLLCFVGPAYLWDSNNCLYTWASGVEDTIREWWVWGLPWSWGSLVESQAQLVTGESTGVPGKHGVWYHHSVASQSCASQSLSELIVNINLWLFIPCTFILQNILGFAYVNCNLEQLPLKTVESFA